MQRYGSREADVRLLHSRRRGKGTLGEGCPHRGSRPCCAAHCQGSLWQSRCKNTPPSCILAHIRPTLTSYSNTSILLRNALQMAMDSLSVWATRLGQFCPVNKSVRGQDTYGITDSIFTCPRSWSQTRKAVLTSTQASRSS